MAAELRGDELEQHRALHQEALKNKPAIEKVDGEFWTAVLPPNASANECDPSEFHWFKVKGKHSVSKIQQSYLKKNQIPILLRQGNNPVSPIATMSQINHFSDDIIVFWSTSGASDAGVPDSTASRQSLQALENTNSVRTPVSVKRDPSQVVKAESDAFKAAPEIPPSAVRPPTQIQTCNTPVTGFKIFSDRYHGNDSLSTSTQVGIEQTLAKFWDGLTPSRRAMFDDEAAQSFKFSTPLASYPTPISAVGEHPPTNALGDRDTTPKSPNNASALVQPKEEGFPAPKLEEATPEQTPEAAQLAKIRLQKVIEDSSPERLEAEVQKTNAFLDTLKDRLTIPEAQSHQDAKHWLQQIETLKAQGVDAPTIIGVVGNTGAGKSSVINAMLDEERLVPTNCMRACTAVVTEMSYNSSNDPSKKYRAEIEFIKASDWQKDLELSLNEMLDPSGHMSSEIYTADSEAGVAYAKVKAVYPHKTKEMLAESSVEELMRDKDVQAVLGTKKAFEKSQPEQFYKELQHYVDSKEKATGGEEKQKRKRKTAGKDKEKKTLEFWPLIKVVRIYTKADALSTGAIVVDLPGVHDSNAARAAVAAGYMKQCTGLWICAPINRAVDDKAAKSLLGESFKRQLKYDGQFSRITFICSKTDDISVQEASDSLGLEEEMTEEYAKIDEIDEKSRALRAKLRDLRETKEVYKETHDEAEDAIDVWDELKDGLENGKVVFAPKSKAEKKRKRSPSKTSRKKHKKLNAENGDDDEDDDFIDDEDEGNRISDNQSDSDVEVEEDRGEPLTMVQIEDKLSELKDTKKRARKEKLAADLQMKEVEEEQAALEKERDEIDTKMRAVCIDGRNGYSRGAIQQDFASGIKELDQETAEEEDAENFNPDEDARDYDAVAKSLPVFCVSSRAYQQMNGRLTRDAAIPGFRSAEQTEIPQLQAHCKKLTEAGRTANCRRYLNNLMQLVLSLSLWASNDGTGLDLTDTQKAAEARWLAKRLGELEKSLDKSVAGCITDMKDVLADNIFERFPEVINLAVDQAPATVSKWGSSVNKYNRAEGGLYWSTYKAVCRRDGLYGNKNANYDFNGDLTEPLMKHLANSWEKAFARRLPLVLQDFVKNAKRVVTSFHSEVEARSRKNGGSIAGLMMLSQQLKTYEATFSIVTSEMCEAINNLQRDANREFIPVVAAKLASAYQYCVQESGSGSYLRMKTHMHDHVDTVRQSMFKESCDEVKNQLNKMCRDVEEHMNNRTDDVFILMRRDYLTVVNGAQVKGEMMPKWERQMRAQISLALEEHEREETGAQDDEDAAMKDDDDSNAERIIPENSHEGARLFLRETS